MIKIYLRDTNQELVNCWQQAFMHCSNFDISCGNIFDIKATAIVSPANSFGHMGGGIDLAYRNAFGMRVEEDLKRKIIDVHYGELIIGNAEIIRLDDCNYDYMISAPTMRLPMNVSNTNNAYLAFRAALIAAKESQFASIACPGLCTLTGRMHPMVCAEQMLVAWERIKDFFK